MAYVSKEDLSKIFQDTEDWYKTDATLKKSVADSIAATKFYDAENYPPLPEKICDKTFVTVTQGRTFETAVNLRKKNSSARIAVHNFASATNPGGGVVHGSRAQEEALCRCSTLYPVLDTDENFKLYYNFHRRRRDSIYTDACIFAPNILICKSDVDLPQRLSQENWVTVDVMTCAAPNLRHTVCSDEELLKIHERRAKHMLTVLAHHGVEIFVTGAFGCGAFGNNPYVVAQAYKNILPEFDGHFKEIIFAIYFTPREKKNFDAFNKTFSENHN
ncbi:MAG: TIGR02452 family protein [Selenomonadaceae bacterium]|nr:TIGR02452 family protein [Selenomonadaceae bacterium]